MKVFLSFLFSFCLISQIFAQEVKIKGINYILDSRNNTASISENKSGSVEGNFIIPSTVKKKKIVYTVTSINSRAFYDCDKLISIVIPNTVNFIGSEAFFNCKKMTSINIPQGVSSIENSTFSNCLGLANIELPESIKSIGAEAFYMCNSLKTINIPEKVESIGHSAFSECNSLTNFSFPKNIEKIENHTFFNCTNLNSIVIADNITHIGHSAFSNCSSLGSITFSNNLLSVGDEVFSNCINLNSITIPDNVASIGQKSFYNCTKLSAIKLPDSLISIGSGAFFGCSSLHSIMIPKSVTTIGEEAFGNCNNLLSISFPEEMTSIAKNTFSNCTKLSSVEMSDNIQSIGENAFSSCSMLSTIVFPNNLISIGNESFLNCNSLKNLFFSDKLVSIGERSFSGCTGLESVVLPNSVVSVGKQAFIGCKSLEFVVYQNISISLAKDAFKGCPKLNKDDIKYDETYASSNNVKIPSKEDKKSSKKKMAMEIDVDKNIPETNKKNEHTFAVIIANEDYVTESDVPFAANDGKMVREYFQKTLGLPSNNIIYQENATLNSMRKAIKDLSNISLAYSGNINIIFYYAGHGIPDESNRESFLLPVDGYGSDITTGYSLTALYQTLGEMNAKTVTVLLDACFSGSKRDGAMIASSRGIAMSAKPGTPVGNMVVFSASSNDETAHQYEEMNHGLFTYFLLKKVQETDGSLNLGDLSEYIRENVMQKSAVVNKKSQTPTFIGSPEVNSDWKKWTWK